MNNSSKQKHRRLSLTAQVNILIVVISLGISLLLVAINSVNYRKAIIDPGIRRLSELEIDEEAYTPYMAYFSY